VRVDEDGNRGSVPEGECIELVVDKAVSGYRKVED